MASDLTSSTTDRRLLDMEFIEVPHRFPALLDRPALCNGIGNPSCRKWAIGLYPVRRIDSHTQLNGSIPDGFLDDRGSTQCSSAVEIVYLHLCAPIDVSSPEVNGPQHSLRDSGGWMRLR